MNGSQMGGILSALSSLTSANSNANAASDAANFKAQQLQLNSEAASMQAESTIAAGNEEASMVSKKVGQTIGQARASAASQGVVADTGSAADVQKSSQVEGAIAEHTIRSNAWRQAWGLKVEASNDLSEAEMTKLEGQGEATNTMLTGGMSALGDIVKGFTPTHA